MWTVSPGRAQAGSSRQAHTASASAPAIDLPNVVNRNGPTELEEGRAAATLADGLTALGHRVRLVPMTSGLYGIARSDGVHFGGADPRREGVALGD